MPNALVITLDGFSASSRQLYPQLFTKVLSRSAVHESLTADDALNYIGSGWPSIIFLSDAAIAREENRDLLEAATDWTRQGCTLLFMGFFAPAIGHDELNTIFKEHLNLKWRVAEYSSHDVRLHHTIDESMLRRTTLIPAFQATAVYLTHVPANELVYAGGPQYLAYAAFARVGLGKLGYIGDVNFGEEPERLILAMCHLDRLEDSFDAVEEL
jgi:hypothetical protein